MKSKLKFEIFTELQVPDDERKLGFVFQLQYLVTVLISFLLL